MNARTALSIAVFLAGLALAWFGWQEANSLASEVSEVFSGSPTDRSMWMMVGGGVLAVFGGGMLLGKR